MNTPAGPEAEQDRDVDKLDPVGEGSAAADVRLVDQQHFETAHRSVARDTDTVNPRADDDHIRIRSHHIVSIVHCLRHLAMLPFVNKLHAIGPQ